MHSIPWFVKVTSSPGEGKAKTGKLYTKGEKAKKNANMGKEAKEAQIL
jgi:hypothetical protein